jgi:hypothetical protein
MDDWQAVAQNKIKRMPLKAFELREAAKEDLVLFATLVNPGYMYGDLHRETFRWMQNYALFGQGEDQTSNKLTLFPRAHLKSHMVATWCAWIITRSPEVTMLYVSATAELAQTQLYAIQNIIGSSVYQRFYPEYINPQEGKREKWNQTKMSVDHDKRRKEGIRDATISTAGLTTNTTGWHADVIVADDLVVPENAYTDDGRESVSRKASQFTSIRNAGGFTMACGTRYHPSDVYSVWKEQHYEVYNKEEEVVDRRPVWEIKEIAVEVDGVFAWPRVVRPDDNKAFGFDNNTLSRIRAEYSDKTQFYAQYYNNPNDPSSDRIKRECFQYYDQRFIKRQGGDWYFKERKLNIYGAVDFAFSLSRKADWTAIVVVGVDYDFNVYVLDIDRFRSDKSYDYFKKIAALHSKWNFKKLSAEVTVAQKVIVNDIKGYVKKEGMSISIEDHTPTRHNGSKEERIAALLEHRYESRNIWHFEGGYTAVLEEELIQARPANDDVKDALASAIAIAVAPRQPKGVSQFQDQMNIPVNSRFGGVAWR